VKLTTHLHLVPRSKNVWSYTSIPQHVFMAWCLVKYRDNFTNFEAFRAVMFQGEVFWIVMPRGVVVGYQRFGGTYYLHTLKM
jgi:hypothetical protein